MSADYTGASADTVQKSVIVPIEEAINGVDGIDYISSNSTSSGSAYISVVFKSGIDPDMAVVMVKNRVAEVEGILPQEVVKTGVHVEKEQRSFLKVIALECPDNRYDNDFITNYFNINLSPRLQRIKGVSRIQLLGNVYAMRIWMDPKRMAEHDLSPSDIEEALNGLCLGCRCCGQHIAGALCHRRYDGGHAVAAVLRPPVLYVLPAYRGDSHTQAHQEHNGSRPDILTSHLLPLYFLKNLLQLPATGD